MMQTTVFTERCDCCNGTGWTLKEPVPPHPAILIMSARAVYHLAERVNDERTSLTLRELDIIDLIKEERAERRASNMAHEREGHADLNEELRIRMKIEADRNDIKHKKPHINRRAMKR